MEVPRLGVQLELQLPACTTATAMWDLSCVCNLHHSSGQRQSSPLSGVRDRTCNLMVPSCIHFHYTMKGTLVNLFLTLKKLPNFSKVAVPFYTSVRNVWGIQCLHNLASTCIDIFFPLNFLGNFAQTKTLTHWVKPGIKPATSWFLVGFVSIASWQEIPIAQDFDFERQLWSFNTK